MIVLVKENASIRIVVAMKFLLWVLRNFYDLKYFMEMSKHKEKPGSKFNTPEPDKPSLKSPNPSKASENGTRKTHFRNPQIDSLIEFHSISSQSNSFTSTLNRARVS
jgi:hypothetical protein